MKNVFVTLKLGKMKSTLKEWRNIEEQAEETGMDLDESLKVFEKILEGHCRLEGRQEQIRKAEEEE